MLHAFCLKTYWIHFNKKNYMKYLYPILMILFLATSCFQDEYWTPKFEEKENLHNLDIPATGKTYDIPFVFSLSWHHTRTSVTEWTYQIRGRFLFDGQPGEIYDTAIDSPIQYDAILGKDEAIMHAHIPANESSEARSVAVQISIDNVAHYYSTISEEDEHDWGEWTTIIDGIQAGQ